MHSRDTAHIVLDLDPDGLKELIVAEIDVCEKTKARW